GGTAARPATFTLGPFLSVGTAGTTAEVAWAGDLTRVGAAWAAGGASGAGQRGPGGRGGPVSHSQSGSRGAVRFLARSRRVARAPATTRQPTPPTIASPVPIRLSVSFPQVVPCASTVTGCESACRDYPHIRRRRSRAVRCAGVGRHH